MQRINTILAIVVLGIMALMVVAALRDMRNGGSLDDLDAESIKRAVGS